MRPAKPPLQLTDTASLCRGRLAQTRENRRRMRNVNDYLFA
jgi:hypothetical protein